MRTVGHILPTGLFAHLFGNTSLRDVELLQRPERKVRSTAPPDLCQASLLALVARLDCVETLFCVTCLIRANVALHGGTLN